MAKEEKKVDAPVNCPKCGKHFMAKGLDPNKPKAKCARCGESFDVKGLK